MTTAGNVVFIGCPIVALYRSAAATAPAELVTLWLPGEELNLDLRVQSAASYR